ncbi:uncharacterized protein [Desmodus rotundus]|uniref:uncharacterized protein isoform X2 n=1 Tax=Desmodus rotundus TaxID=9430 RepID=UPI0039E264E0
MDIGKISSQSLKEPEDGLICIFHEGPSNRAGRRFVSREERAARGRRLDSGQPKPPCPVHLQRTVNRLPMLSEVWAKCQSWTLRWPGIYPQNGGPHLSAGGGRCHVTRSRAPGGAELAWDSLWGCARAFAVLPQVYGEPAPVQRFHAALEGDHLIRRRIQIPEHPAAWGTHVEVSGSHTVPQKVRKKSQLESKETRNYFSSNKPRNIKNRTQS